MWLTQVFKSLTNLNYLITDIRCLSNFYQIGRFLSKMALYRPVLSALNYHIKPGTSFNTLVVLLIQWVLFSVNKHFSHQQNSVNVSNKKGKISV